MGSQWVDGSPSWDSIGSNLVSGFQGAPQKALGNMSAADEIAWNRRVRGQQIKAADAYGPALPEAAVAPSTMLVPGPFTGDPISDPGVLRDLPQAPVQFIDPRKLALAQAQRNLFAQAGPAAILKDPTNAAPMLAQGTVAATGMPSDQAARSVLQFQTTGRFPTAEERAPNPVHNLNITSPDGSIRTIATADNQTEFGTGRPLRSIVGPTDTVTATGATSQTPTNPIESAPIAQNNFNQMAVQALMDERKGIHMSEGQARAAIMLRDNAWQKEMKTIENPETGEQMLMPTFKIAPPTSGAAAWLLQRLDDYEKGAHLAPPAAAGPAAAAPAATAAPAVTAPAAAAPEAAAPAPIVPPPAVPSWASQTPTSVGLPGNPQKIVDEYMRQPVVHGYEMAKSGYSGFVKNLPLNNQTSDLAMIVGAAKILDPPSVVREGEVENVRRTGGVMDQFIGMMQGMKGEGRLPAEVRMQLWNMVNAQMTGLNENVKPIYEQHAVRLAQAKLDPNKYLPPPIELKPIDRSYVNTRTGRTDNPATERQDTATTSVPTTGPRAARPPVPVTAPATGAQRTVDDIINGR